MGVGLGQKILKRKVFDSKPQFFYLGTGIPVREGDIKSYRGLVKDFCYWDTCLAGNEVFELHDNYGINYLTSQGQYSSASKLKIYYDMKHCILDREFDYRHGKVINLVNPANTRSYAKTENCIPKTEMELTDVKIMKPFRRHSSFELQKHQRNGYFNGRWRTESTRLNQVHFYDQVVNNKTNLQNDGLTTLHFELLSEKNTRNITHLKVNL